MISSPCLGKIKRNNDQMQALIESEIKDNKEKTFNPCQQSIKANRYSIFWALSFLIERREMKWLMEKKELQAKNLHSSLYSVVFYIQKLCKLMSLGLLSLTYHTRARWIFFSSSCKIITQCIKIQWQNDEANFKKSNFDQILIIVLLLVWSN